MNTGTVDGVEYLYGSAGSFIIACEKCGDEHFRTARDYFRNPTWHTCFTCPSQQMVPIRVDEIETKWRPFWRSLGMVVEGDPCAKCQQPWSAEHERAAHSASSNTHPVQP